MKAKRSEVLGWKYPPQFWVGLEKEPHEPKENAKGGKAKANRPCRKPRGAE